MHIILHFGQINNATAPNTSGIQLPHVAGRVDVALLQCELAHCELFQRNRIQEQFRGISQRQALFYSLSTPGPRALVPRLARGEAPDFLAPEVMQSYWWGLGILAFKMVTGAPLFVHGATTRIWFVSLALPASISNEKRLVFCTVSPSRARATATSASYPSRRFRHRHPGPGRR